MVANAMRTTFDVVRLYGSKRYKCACGRRLARRRTFEQTVNPWNVDAHGHPKSREDIARELAVEHKLWLSEPDPCEHLKPLVVDKKPPTDFFWTRDGWRRRHGR